MVNAKEDRYYLPVSFLCLVLQDQSFVNNEKFVLQEKFYTDTLELESSLKFHRAGARRDIYYESS
jgi:hypothetical protein